MVSSLQFFEKVEWNDKGNYTCIAENGAIAPIEQSNMVLSVVHEPVVLNEKFPNEALAAADVGKTVSSSKKLTNFSTIGEYASENNLQKFRHE